MKGEERREILDLPPDVRALVGECELTGKRTIFTRNEHPVVILVSHDEYTALRETLAIGNDAALRARIEAGDAQVARNALLLAEELTGERVANDRLRLVESVEGEWQALTDADRDAVRRAFAVIDEDPIVGAPLFEPLRGYWSTPAGGVRIIYRIVAEARFVVILSVS